MVVLTAGALWLFDFHTQQPHTVTLLSPPPPSPPVVLCCDVLCCTMCKVLYFSDPNRDAPTATPCVCECGAARGAVHTRKGKVKYIVTQNTKLNKLKTHYPIICVKKTCEGRIPCDACYTIPCYYPTLFKA